MDPPATADPASSTHSTLRKRLLVPIDTSSRGGGDWSRDPRSERASKVQEAEGSMAPEPPAGDEVEGRDVEAGEPMSPAGRLFRERHFNCYIVAMIGLGAAVDVAAARDGLESTLVRHPRFCSVQVREVLLRTHAVTFATPSLENCSTAHRFLFPT
jgi:hypothetical protein